MLGERSNTERFGGVVPGIHHHNSHVLGGDGGMMRAFADDECIHFQLPRFAQRLGRCTRSCAYAPSASAASRGEASEPNVAAVRARKFLDRAQYLVGSAVTLSPDTDVDGLVSCEPIAGLQAEGLSEKRVISESWVGVEREMGRVHGDIICHQ